MTALLQTGKRRLALMRPSSGLWQSRVRGKLIALIVRHERPARTGR
jgi:hypothetical protein